jgi:hypothetical protein
MRSLTYILALSVGLVTLASSDAMDSCNIPFTARNRFRARLAPMRHEMVT